MKQTTYNIAPSGNQMHVEREFNGSLEQVWSAWTESELLDQWWAPLPFKAVTKSMDFREGGRWHYYMLGPAGEQHWCMVNYFKIELQQRFTGDDLFCDEEGNPNKDFPTMLWDVSFSFTNNTTKVNVKIDFKSKEDLEKIVEMGFKEGFSMAHENLDKLLEKTKAFV